MRPSGVVSQVLLLRQQPCTITTGTCCDPRIGIWYCTYIWLMVISPDCAGIGPVAGCVTVLFSPPTKKLPCSRIVSGVFFLTCAEVPVAAQARQRIRSALRRVIAFLGWWMVDGCWWMLVVREPALGQPSMSMSITHQRARACIHHPPSTIHNPTC